MRIEKQIVRMKTRRGVSQIIGSIFALAIVASIGGILVIQGNQGITAFTSVLEIFETVESKGVQEQLVIEHVRFVPTSDQVTVWFRNTGFIEMTISKMVILKINSQEIIVNKDDLQKNIFQEQIQGIDVSGSDVSLPSGCSTWDDVVSCDLIRSEFRISLTTIRGNTFETIAAPFNT